MVRIEARASATVSDGSDIERPHGYSFVFAYGFFEGGIEPEEMVPCLGVLGENQIPFERNANGAPGLHGKILK